MNLNECKKQEIDTDSADYRVGLDRGFREGYREGREDSLPQLSQEEEAYRRGFHQGFHVGRNNSVVTDLQIQQWRHCTRKLLGAPGTPFENHDFSKELKK